METKSLLYGLIGFFIGGLLVSVAATTFDKPVTPPEKEMTMSEMTAALKNKAGDDYDKVFLTSMIAHHQAAVEMAKLSVERAKHAEIKELSQEIILAQDKEIRDMKLWQREWGYDTTMNHHGMAH